MNRRQHRVDRIQIRLEHAEKLVSFQLSADGTLRSAEPLKSLTPSGKLCWRQAPTSNLQQFFRSRRPARNTRAFKNFGEIVLGGRQVLAEGKRVPGFRRRCPSRSAASPWSP